MHIDRVAFLELTIALSLAACGRAGATAGAGRAPEPTVIPLQPPPVAASTTGSASARSAPATPGVAAEDTSCNATGSLAACDRIGPACEGLLDECRSIGESFRPRVAEKFAECFAKARPPRCREKALGACMRKAVESACVEPFAEKVCHDFMAACTAAKKPPKYSFEQCTKVVSAVNGGPGGHEWDNANMGLLGPTSESGSCSLQYVLPYQPWGGSWK